MIISKKVIMSRTKLKKLDKDKIKKIRLDQEKNQSRKDLKKSSNSSLSIGSGME